MVAAQYTLHVQSRTATAYHAASPRLNIRVSIQEILLILIEVVLRTWLSNINKMARHAHSIHHIVFQILARPQIHLAIHLTAISTDDFRIPESSQTGSQTGFARGRWSQDSNNIKAVNGESRLHHRLNNRR